MVAYLIGKLEAANQNDMEYDYDLQEIFQVYKDTDDTEKTIKLFNKKKRNVKKSQANDVY